MGLRLPLVLGLLMLSAIGAGCDDMTPIVVQGPSPIVIKGAYMGPYPPRVVNRGFFLDLQPPIVTSDFLRGTGCSVGSTFVVPFVLIVRSTGSSAVTLVNVAVTFVDTLGVYAPVIALGRSTLEDRFGRLTVPRSDRRFFDLVYESECTTRPTGVLAVEVTTSFRGETSSSMLRLQVQ